MVGSGSSVNKKCQVVKSSQNTNKVIDPRELMDPYISDPKVYLIGYFDHQSLVVREYYCFLRGPDGRRGEGVGVKRDVDGPAKVKVRTSTTSKTVSFPSWSGQER